MEIATGSIRGMGISLPPMIITVLGVCVFRIVWVFTVFKAFNTSQSLYISYPISWVITFIAEVIVFIYILRKKQKLKS